MRRKKKGGSRGREEREGMEADLSVAEERDDERGDSPIPTWSFVALLVLCGIVVSFVVGAAALHLALRPRRRRRGGGGSGGS